MIRTILCTCLALTVLAGTAFGDTSYERIMAAYGEGLMTADEAAVLLVRSVLSPELLPMEYTEDTDPMRCGTPALHEATLLVGSSGTEVPEVLTLVTRPTLSGPEYTFNSPDGYFKLHWTDSGADATTLSYAQGIAGEADYSWGVQCDQMGYFNPPPDNGAGGDDRYDIYVMSIGPLGYTSSGGEYKPPDSTHASSASHIVMSKGLGTGLRSVTVAHEFQHAVQMSYDYNEPVWFMENCAVWMEEQVYPAINDYVNYLHGGDNPLRKPWWDIRHSGSDLYHYGGVTWAFYISGRLGDLAIREVWENCAAVGGANMFAAQQDMFGSHSMTWEMGFMEYNCWRWFTGNNWYAGCGMFFDEAPLWTPGPYVFSYHTISSLPASGDEGVYEPDTYGIHWIKVDLSSYQGGWVQFDFNGRDYFEWNLGVIMWDTAGDHLYQWYDCDPTTGDKSVSVSTAGWDYAIFIPAFITETSLDHYYEFDVSYQTGIEGGETNPPIDLRVASNPLRVGDAVTFDLPSAGRAELMVFDMTGRKVAVLFDDQAPAGTSTVQLIGENLSEGTYFVSLFAGDQICTRKIVLTD